MDMPSPHQRYRVIVVMDMSAFAGKEKLSGILDFRGEGRIWEIQLMCADEGLTAERLRQARRDGIDGCILLCFPTTEQLRCIFRSGIPFVVETDNRLLDGLPRQAAAISLDTETLAKAAAEHFTAQHVFRDFGYVGDKDGSFWSNDRQRAFVRQMKERGHDCRTIPVTSRRLGAWLKSLAKPAALLAANDETAARVLCTARREGLETPKDIALLGIDDNAAFCDPLALDSIAIDLRAGGRRAAKLLERILRKRLPIRPAVNYYGITGIGARGSSVRVGAAFELVRSALAFIDERACSGIGVDDVVLHLGVSRRLADLRFREALGSTIADCIRNRRLREAKRLLSETDTPIADIANAVGISNANHLKNIFLRHVGITMRAFRKASHRRTATQ